MRSSLFIAVLSLFLPLSAFAEEVSVSRAIEFPSIKKTTPVLVELDYGAWQDPNTDFLVINSKSIAVPSGRFDDEANRMSDAIFDAVPESADTLPATNIEQLRDGDSTTFFQPHTTREYVFAFHVNKTITPSVLALDIRSGSLDSVSVRLGLTPDKMRDAVIGTESSTYIHLSGEQAKYFEVTIRVYGGVLRLNELSLLTPRKRIGFIADPKESYRLLYGLLMPLNTPILQLPINQNALQATLGPVTTLSSTSQEDYDGVSTALDNCPLAWNASQEDIDTDGIGDVCDNCPRLSNANQSDVNKNGVGDSCEDPDRDGVLNNVDNCRTVSNPQQADEDQDGIGNVCDTSDDRWSEGQPWLLYASMAAIILVLTGIGAMILKRTPKK